MEKKDDTVIPMILELDWMNVSSASNDIRRNGGNIVGVGSHARQISQEPPPKLARTLFCRKQEVTEVTD